MMGFSDPFRSKTECILRTRFVKRGVCLEFFWPPRKGTALMNCIHKHDNEEHAAAKGFMRIGNILPLLSRRLVVTLPPSLSIYRSRPLSASSHRLSLRKAMIKFGGMSTPKATFSYSLQYQSPIRTRTTSKEWPFQSTLINAYPY